MSKKSELMLAVWPNFSPRQYWRPEDTCRGMWVELRSVHTHDDGAIDLDTFNDGIFTRDIGIYIWAGTGGGIDISVKAHEVHSADARELQALAKWLNKANAKIKKADIPKDFGVKETLILTLRAIGAKKAVMVKSDANYKSCHEVIDLSEALTLANYGGPLDDMEAMRQTPYAERRAA